MSTSPPTPNSDEFVHSRDISIFAYNRGDLTELPGYLGISDLQSLSQSFGSPTPMRVRDPARPGKTKIIGYTYTDEELPTTSIQEMWHERAVNYLIDSRRNGCLQNWIARIGKCGRRDSLDDWTSLLVIEGLQLTNFEIGNLGGDTDQSTNLTGQFTGERFYYAYPAVFGIKGADDIVAEILRVIYADDISCGACAPASNGAQKIYALQALNSGSPGLSSALIYSLDGGATISSVDIPNFDANAGSDLVGVGRWIMMFSETDESHQYFAKSTLNPTATDFIEVTSGYVAGNGPRRAYVVDPQTVIVTAANGYVYRSEDITTSVSVIEDGSNTTENGNAIHGQGGGIIVSVHDNNDVLFSLNSGRTFALLTGPEVGANLTAVHVVNRYQWYIGTNSGKLWYTPDGGTTWTQRVLRDQNNISVINDIQASPEKASHMVMTVEASAAGRIYRSFSGGRNWDYDDPAIQNTPTAVRFNSVALADVYGIAIGGLGVGTDGILAIAEAT